MDLNTLKIFARVAEHQSFTKAARDLGIEKSTVSSKITELERRLETRLLNRSTRCVSLTEAGEGYYRYCQQIVENAQEADEFVKTFTTEPQGILRISAPEGITRILFQDLLDSFLRRYEKIDVEIELSTRRDIDPVREGFDIVLLASSSPLKDSSFVAQYIFEVKMGFYASADYIKEHGKITTLEEFCRHPVIHFVSPKDWSFNMQFRKGNKLYQPEYRTRVIINDIESCITSIQKGLGIGMLPSSAVRNEVRSRTFVQIIPEYELPSTAIYAVYPSRKWRPTKLKVFLEFLIEEWGRRQSMDP